MPGDDGTDPRATPDPLDADDAQMLGLLAALDADYSRDQGVEGLAVAPSKIRDYLPLFGTRLHPRDVQRLQALSARTWATRFPNAAPLPVTERFDQMHAVNAALAAGQEPVPEQPGALRTFGYNLGSGTLRTLTSSVAGLAGLGNMALRQVGVTLPRGNLEDAARAATEEVGRQAAEFNAVAARPITATAGNLVGSVAGVVPLAATGGIPAMASQTGLSIGAEVKIDAARAGIPEKDSDLPALGAGVGAGLLTAAFPGTPGSVFRAFRPPPAIAPGTVKALSQVGAQQAIQSSGVGAARDLGVAAATGQAPDWGEFGWARLYEAMIGGPLGVAGEGVVQGLRGASRPRPTIRPQDLNQLAVLEALERARQPLPPPETPLPARPAEPVPLAPRALPEDAVRLPEALAEEQMLARETSFPEEPPQVQRELDLAAAGQQRLAEAFAGPRLGPEPLPVAPEPLAPPLADLQAALASEPRLSRKVTLEGKAFPVEPGKTPQETAAAMRALQEAPTDRFVKPAAKPAPEPVPEVASPVLPEPTPAPAEAAAPVPVLRGNKYAEFVGDVGGSLGLFKLANDRYVVGATSRKAVTDARLSGRIPYAMRGASFATEAEARAAAAKAPAAKGPSIRQVQEVRRGPAPKELTGEAVDEALTTDPRMADLKARLDEPGADLEAVRAEAKARLPAEEVRAAAKAEQPALEAGEPTSALRTEVEAPEIQEAAPKALGRVKALADSIRAGKRPKPEKVAADLFDAANELAGSSSAEERAYAAAVHRLILPRLRGPEGIKALPEIIDKLAEGLKDARPMMLPPADSPVAASTPDGLAPAERELVVRAFAKDLGLPEPHLVKDLTLRGQRVNGAAIGDLIMVDDSGHLAPMIGALAHEKIHATIRGLDEGGLADLKARLADLRDVPGIGELETRLGKEGLPAGEHGLVEEAISDAAVHAVLTNRNNVLSEIAPRTQKVLLQAFRTLGRAIKKMLRSLVGLKDVTPRAKASLENLADWLLRYKPDTPEQMAARKLRDDSLRADMVEAYNAFKTGDLGEQLQNAIVKTLGRGARVLGSKAEGGGVAQAVSDAYTKILVRDIDMARKYAEFGHVHAASDAADASSAQAIEPLLRAATTLEQLPKARRKLVDATVFENHVRQIRRGQDNLPPETDAEQHAWMRRQGVTAYEEGIIKEIYSSLDAANKAHQDAIFRFAGMEPEPLPQLEAKIEAESDPVKAANMQAVYDTVKSSQDAATYGYVPLVRESKGAFLVVKNPVDPAKNLRLPVSRLDALNEAKMAELAREKSGSSAAEYTIENDPVFSDERFDSMATLESQLRTALGKAGLPDSADATSVQATLKALTPALVRGRLSAHQLRSRAITGFETDLVTALKHYSHTARGGLRAMLFHGEARPWLDKIAASGRTNVQAYTNKWVQDLYQNSNTPGAKIVKIIRMGTAARLLSNAGQLVNSTFSNFVANPWTGMSLVGYGHMGRSYLTGLTEQMKIHPLILTQLGHSNLTTMAKILRRTANMSESARMSAWAEWLDSKAAGVEMANLRATLAEHAGAKDLAAAIRRTAEETNLFADIGAKDINSRPMGPSVQGGLEHLVAASIWMNTQTDRAGRLGSFATFYKVAKEFTPSDWERQQYRNNYVGEQTPETWARWATNYMVGGTGRMSRPPAFRGPVGGLVSQLAGYGLAQARNFAWMLKDPFTGPVGPGGRKQELLRLAAPLGLAATWVGLAGIRNGLPLLNPLVGTIEKWFMDQPIDQMMNEQAQEGSALAQMWSRGAAQYLPQSTVRDVALETGRAAGPRGLIADRIRNFVDLPSVRAGQMVYEGTGAVVDGIEHGDAETVVDGLTQVTGGIPKAVRDVNKSYTRGLTTTSPDERTPYAARAAKARTVIPADQVTTAERVTLALGSTPERVQTIRTAERALSQVRADNEVERSIWIRDQSEALAAQDREKIDEGIARLHAMREAAMADLEAAFKKNEAEPTAANKARWIEARMKRDALKDLPKPAWTAVRQLRGGAGAFRSGKGRTGVQYLRTEVPSLAP